jgi:hypothetical protein
LLSFGAPARKTVFSLLNEPLSLPFTVEWSNGMVEGQVNKLKLIKRQMYGRANFDLLRLRVLHRDEVPHTKCA